MRDFGEATRRRAKESIIKSIMPSRNRFFEEKRRKGGREGGRRQADKEKAVSLCVGWNFKCCVGERGVILKVLVLWLIKSENFHYFTNNVCNRELFTFIYCFCQILTAYFILNHGFTIDVNNGLGIYVSLFYLSLK